MKNSTFLSQKSSILVFLVALFLFVGAGKLSAQITFSANEPTIGQIIKAVKAQSSYQFFYDSKLSDMKVNSVDVKDVSLDALLKVALKDKNIDYKIEENICYLSASKAQESSKTNTARTVTGKVTDSKGGGALAGVTVTIPGTTVGVVTNGEGKYSINVPSATSQLSFSYIGYDSQVIIVGSRTVLDIALAENSQLLDDVVVTAMGIKRETKALTYNVQTVAADEITTVKDANLMNSLAGKIAGVTINQSSSGVGGSTRVVMRGTKSLFGENNALYVLDGIPLSSLRSKQSDNFYEIEAQGDSEGVSNINPDDIESMSVLTGAAAAALYGNRGANGVILITTKKGVAGKTTVNYSNNTNFTTPFVMPQFQNTYGKDGEGYSSWGSKMDSPSSYKPENFFQTGATTMNSLSVSSGNDKNQLHASIGAVNSRGMIPNSDYSRYNFTMRTTSELVKDKLTLDLSANYIQQDDQNSISQGLYYNPLVAVYLFPPGDDINRFVPYQIWNPERDFHTQNWSYQNESLEGLKQNPFWTANKNVFQNDRNRFIVSGALKYDIADWINVTGRLRLDKANGTFERKLYASTDLLFAKSPAGNYSKYELDNKNIYADFLINIDKTFCQDFRLTANLGASFNDEQSVYEGYDGPLIKAVDFFHSTNVNVEQKDEVHNHTRTTAMYAAAQLSYKNFVYLDITGRMDYFSTLYGTSSTSVFYPSVGLSGVLSELLPANKVLTFWKVRGSYSQVGNPPPAYLTDMYTSMTNGVIASSSVYPIKDLKAEKTKAFEVGTDIKMWGNKLQIAYTYYNTDTYNQLFRYNMPPTTGYAFSYANAGKVNNWGMELSVGLNQNIGPVEWNSTLTYSFNRNKIESLLPEYIQEPITGELMLSATEFEVANAGGYRMILKEGGSMSDIYVTSFKRDMNGNVLVNPSTGRFEIDQKNFVKIGSAAPDYNIGFRNNFAWKGINLGFLIDARVGGVVVSSTQALMDQYGVSQATADARDNEGVPMNMGKIDAKTYYEIISAGKNGAALSEYTYSATNVRLRELTLGYTLPRSWFKDKLDITVSFVGRNLFMFYNHAPFDPELTANTGTYYQGYDYFMPPSQRSLGFGVNVKF